MNDSKTFNFLNEDKSYSIHLFDGQKLIQELAIIHKISGEGFHYFRDSILSIIHLSHFLKAGEGLGFFIDSEIPYFRLKVELNSSGNMRTLLIPDFFNEFPKNITGNLRISKIMPHSRNPYNSQIKLEEIEAKELVNLAIKTSYQMEAIVSPSEISDHSIMIVRLPGEHDKTIEEYWKENSKDIFDLANELRDEPEKIQNSLEKKGLTYLYGKEINFKCNCSRERMLTGVQGLINNVGIDDVFKDDKEIELKCDYCHTAYIVLRSEFEI